MTFLYPTRECSHAFVIIISLVLIRVRTLTVFTDGSKIESGVASTFCAMESGGVLVNEAHCTLDNNNFAYHAELYALDWVESQKKHVKSFPDNLSSLQAIHTFRT